MHVSKIEINLVLIEDITVIGRFTMRMGTGRLNKESRCTMMGKLSCYALIGNDPFMEAGAVGGF